MLKGVLNVAGWLFVLFAGVAVSARFSGADDSLSRVNQVRIMDLSAAAFAFGLIFLALAAIITRLDALLAKRAE